MTTIRLTGIMGKFADCFLKSLFAAPNITLNGCCRSPGELSDATKARIESMKGEAQEEGASCIGSIAYIRQVLRGRCV